MQPYYERAGITIYHADCREVLPTLATESVDLVLTDPPYGQGYESGRRAETFGRIAGDEDSSVALAALPALFAVLRNRRHAYLFGRWDFTALPVAEPVELVWDKGMMVAGDLSVVWGVQHEYIQFVSKHASRSHREAGYGRLAARLRRGSILRHKRSGDPKHPTEKPVPLLRELIEASSLMGETVIDPFMGVGSTLVAAHLEGRHAIGIEIEERYCEIAANRLAQDVLPLAIGAD